MSLQAAYTLLLSPVTGVTTTMYMVFSKLSRSGFRVVRHQGMIEQNFREKVEENIDVDEDVDSSKLIPLYGVPLVSDPGTEPPFWLQDIRDNMAPYMQYDIPQSLYGINSWIRDIVEDVVDDAISCCEVQKRKMRQKDELKVRFGYIHRLCNNCPFIESKIFLQESKHQTNGLEKEL